MKYSLSIIFLLFSIFANAQVASYCIDPSFEEKVASTIGFTVPVISVEELNEKMDEEILLLDIREQNEYDIGHIDGAICFGYDEPLFELLHEVPKDKEIIVYCSIGYRSEKVGEMLLERGYENVLNLYGSIFEWSNAGYPIFTSDGSRSDQIHTYNKRWSKWVNEDKIQKTW